MASNKQYVENLNKILQPLTCSPTAAANTAKKNPARPVVPTSRTNAPISTGTIVKNFSLYASSSGKSILSTFTYFFLC